MSTVAELWKAFSEPLIATSQWEVSQFSEPAPDTIVIYVSIEGRYWLTFDKCWRPIATPNSNRYGRDEGEPGTLSLQCDPLTPHQADRVRSELFGFPMPCKSSHDVP